MRLVALSSAGVVVVSMVAWVACSGDDSSTPGPTNDAGSNGDSATTETFGLGVPCTDSIASIYGDPGALPAKNGTIIKCAIDTDISMTDLSTRAKNDVDFDDPPAVRAGYSGKPFTSGAHVYRILYRTERGDAAKSPGYSSATVYIPDTPRAAGKLPLIIGGHATWGQGAKCPPDQGHSIQAFVTGDYEMQVFPIVGHGLPIIISDLAGYANYGAAGNPPSAYAQYEDVAKSTLDSARALANMFPNASNGKIALIGHSQGGHSAFSAVAYQPTYAPEIKIAALATYSPLWLSQRSWGALLYVPNDYPLSTAPLVDAVSVWYHYTHAELLDGPGHGIDVFAADKQALIKNFIANDCEAQGWDGVDAGSEFPDLQAAATTATQLFDPAFAASVKASAGLGNPCKAGDAVCTKWVARYLHDRPHLVPALTPPILIEWGTDDDTIDPGHLACVTERLKQDNVPYSLCTNAGAGHGGVVRRSASYVVDWIASKTLGEAAPAACDVPGEQLTDDAGVAISCTTPPPND